MSRISRVIEGEEHQSAANSTMDTDIIFEPAVLPCGRTIHNRLVKAAMYEHLATFFGGPPNEYHFRLYSEWAKHGWGMVITGNVAVMPDHLTLGRDTTIPSPNSIESEEALEPFVKLAECIHGSANPSQTTPGPGDTDVDIHRSHRSSAKTLAIMQLNHPGRQSSNMIGGRLPFRRPLAPSPIRVGSSDPTVISRLLNALLFQTPQEMTAADISRVIDRFVDGAILAYRAKFDGVQLHVAHGYLLAQFLSPKANRRSDTYSAEKALDITHTIARRIRDSTAHDFVISIKLNAADYSSSATSEPNSLTDWELRALKHLLNIANWGLVDIVEISGGDYEKPDFMMSSEPSTLKSLRQAFFARFSQHSLQALDALRQSAAHPVPLILLTGGLRTPALLRSALESRHADLLGIGRGSVLRPDLPSTLLEWAKDRQRWDDAPFNHEPALRQPMILEYPPFSWLWSCIPKIRLIGAGVSMAWYVVAMRRMTHPAFKIDAEIWDSGSLVSILWMWAWFPKKSARSRRGRFASFFFFLFILLGLLAVLIQSARSGSLYTLNLTYPVVGLTHPGP